MTTAYTLISVILVSLISFSGALALVFKRDFLKDVLILFVSFSAGALLGDVFIHILPEVVEKLGGFDLIASLYVLSGIVIFFIIEKFILWRHCHHYGETGHEACVQNVKVYAINNLLGDMAHNFIDGVIIAGSYLANPGLGITTTLAVVLHEIPQELGDFGVLIHGGFSTKRALFYNFLSALTAVAGAILILIFGKVAGLTTFLLAFTAGSFIYIASSDLIPQLHHEHSRKLLNSLIELLFFLMGIGVMWLLLFVE